jgi:hypothetical protein
MGLQHNFELIINAEDHRKFGQCDCCGNATERVWEYIYESDAAAAAYFVEWTPGHADRAANFDLIVGKWGDDTTQLDRVAISLAFRQLQSGPSFMVVNAADRLIASSSLISEALSRDQVLRNPISERVFAMCDAIYLKDHRIVSLSQSSTER